MNLRIKRRRFGQLAIVSATMTTLTNLASKVFAQQPQPIIYGLKLPSNTTQGAVGRQNNVLAPTATTLSQQTTEELYGREFTNLSEVANVTPRVT